jgi:hypothetical protein
MKNLLLILTALTITFYFYKLSKNKTIEKFNHDNNQNNNIRSEQGLAGINKPEYIRNPDDTFENRAKLHALFHMNIFNLLNNMIIHQTQSKEVKESYISVVKANMGLLNIGRGYEHNFFNGTLSKNIAITFLEDLVNLYTKFILEEDHAFTNEDIEIFKYMVDNHTIMMKDYQRIQKGKKGNFKKYKILYEKELRKMDNFEYNIIRLDGLEVLEDNIDTENKKDEINNEKFDENSDISNREIRNINITETRN